LTLVQMEERRLAAATLLRQGRFSQAKIVRQLGQPRQCFALGRNSRPGLPAWPGGSTHSGSVASRLNEKA